MWPLKGNLLSMSWACEGPPNRKFDTCVPQGHLREGKCHLSLGNAVAAIRCFRKVLELEPSNRDAHKEVGIQNVALFSFSSFYSNLNAVSSNCKQSADSRLFAFRISRQKTCWSSKRWQVLASNRGISERYKSLSLNDCSKENHCISWL